MSNELEKFQDILQDIVAVNDEDMMRSLRANAKLVGLIATVFDLIPAAQTKSIVLSALPKDFKAAQFSVFDNHTFNERGVRWGGNLKVFTGAVDFSQKPAFSANVALWPKAEVAKRLKGLQTNKKNPISDETKGLAMSLAEDCDFVGILKHADPRDGTFFYENHIVGMKLTGNAVTHVEVISPNVYMILPAFVDTDATGNGLKGKAVAQSRFSQYAEMAGWTTGEGVRHF